MKICLECAEGGHLDEILSIINAFDGNDVFFITTLAPTTEDLKKDYSVYYVRKQYNTKTMAAVYLREFILIFKLLISIFQILVNEKPDLIVSTGGGCTIPLFFLGKLFRIKMVFIESLARVNKPSLTGRIVYPFSDVFLVQWENMLKFYKNGKYWGRVL